MRTNDGAGNGQQDKGQRQPDHSVPYMAYPVKPRPAAAAGGDGGGPNPPETRIFNVETGEIRPWIKSQLSKDQVAYVKEYVWRVLMLTWEDKLMYFTISDGPEAMKRAQEELEHLALKLSTHGKYAAFAQRILKIVLARRMVAAEYASVMRRTLDDTDLDEYTGDIREAAADGASTVRKLAILSEGLYVHFVSSYLDLGFERAPAEDAARELRDEVLEAMHAVTGRCSPTRLHTQRLREEALSAFRSFGVPWKRWVSDARAMRAHLEDRCGIPGNVLDVPHRGEDGEIRRYSAYKLLRATLNHLGIEMTQGQVRRFVEDFLPEHEDTDPDDDA